ncbi:MAG: SDR family oxidoreductase [Anaerolineales bacterium]|jgi:hypothetical protein|nr:SDR family oxidoreductase [Anaerolineales bacterium]
MLESKTAFITGASAGLGAEFARQLAAQGYHLILTARRFERLQKLADQLTAQHGSRVEVLRADLSDPLEVEILADKLRSTPDLDLLVNNAGFSVNDRFSDGDLQKHLDMIQVHVLASMVLARAALPVLQARRQGGIINVASVAAFFPAGNTTYTATKAYLVNFSRALQLELLDSGIHVQALCPGFTYTEFHDTPELKEFRRSSIPSLFWLKAEHVVRTSLKDMRRGKVVSVPGWTYAAVVPFARVFLAGSLLPIAARLYRKMQR